MSEMENRIAVYLAHRMPSASDINVDELSQIQGGSSQETFRMRVRWRDGDTNIEKRLILRRSPVSGLVNAEGDVEFLVYRALTGLGLPVPGVHFLEMDGAWLDRPFFIMDMMTGQPGHFYVAGDPYEGNGAAIGRQFWHLLGKLAAVDHRAVGLEGLRGGALSGGLWSNELSYWEAMLDAGERAVEPIVRGAIRWLRRNPPPEAMKPAIVHGDYRAGNFLFTSDGTITAILDWEMCHIGDPLEDIAWALDAMWPMTKNIPMEEGLVIWEAASGLTIDRAALDWWRLFAPVKASGIWTTAEASIVEGKSSEMVVAMSAVRAGHFHRNEILTLMGERGVFG